MTFFLPSYLTTAHTPVAFLESYVHLSSRTALYDDSFREVSCEQ